MQKKKIKTDTSIRRQSKTFSFLVLASNFKCKIPGKNRASGAQANDPTRPRNLSSLPPRIVAMIAALSVTQNLLKLEAQYNPLLLL